MFSCSAGNQVLQERLAEKADLTQSHQRDIEQLRQEHKREMNVCIGTL